MLAADCRVGNHYQCEGRVPGAPEVTAGARRRCLDAVRPLQVGTGSGLQDRRIRRLVREAVA